MVAAIDSEIGFDGAGFIEGHIGTDSGVKLGLDVGIRDEEEGERLWGRRSEKRGRSRSSEAGGSEESEKLPAGGHVSDDIARRLRDKEISSGRLAHSRREDEPNECSNDDDERMLLSHAQEKTRQWKICLTSLTTQTVRRFSRQYNGFTIERDVRIE
jgi:hypothetical protein